MNKTLIGSYSIYTKYGDSYPTTEDIYVLLYGKDNFTYTPDYVYVISGECTDHETTNRYAFCDLPNELRVLFNDNLCKSIN